MDAAAAMAVEAWRQWWSQSVVEFAFGRGPVAITAGAGSLAAVQAVTDAGAPSFLKPIIGLFGLGAVQAGRRFAQGMVRHGAAITQPLRLPPLQLRLPPAAAPLLPLHWRAVWFVLTSVLSISGPAVVDWCQGIARARRADTNVHQAQDIRQDAVSETASAAEGATMALESALSTASLLWLRWLIEVMTRCIPCLIGFLVSVQVHGRRRQEIDVVEVPTTSEAACSTDEPWKSQSPSTEIVMRRRSNKEGMSDPKRLAFGQKIGEPQAREPPKSVPQFIARLQHQHVSRGWSTWVSRHAEVTRLRRWLLVAVRTWLGTKQRAAWQRWAVLAGRRCRLAAAAAGFRRPGMRHAFNRWVAVTESALSSGALLGEALASLRSVGLRRAFSSWRAASERLLGLSCLGYSILARETRMGFATWQENAFEMQSRRGAMASAVSSLLHLRERRGFHSWSVAARGMKRAQQLICRAALRMANVGLGNGWQTWVQHAAHRKHALGVLRSSAGFFLGSCRARCFGLWRAASRAYSHASAQLAIGARFIAHLQHQHVSRGWSTWVSRHAEVTRLRRCLLVAVRTWLGSKQRAAWQSWSTLAARHRQLASAAAGFCRPGMRHALLAWRETARQGCACDSAMHRACMGLRMLSVRRALTTWAAASAHGTERELMSRALGMLMNLKLARGWATWVCAARTEGEMQRRIRTAVSAWLGSRQREAWARWCEMADVWGALASSATVLRYPSLRAALMTWAEVTESALSSGALLGEALASLRSVGLRRAFSSWRAASERLLGLSCLGYSILARETRMGFATWQENAFEMQSRRGAMASAVSSLLHLRERRGFHSWSVAARGMKRAQQLICRAALRMANVGLGNGWQTWVQHAAHRKHALGVLRSSAGFFLGSCRARCFGLWRAASRAYSHASAQLAIGARFIAHLQHQHVSRGWSTWVSRHAEVTRLRRCLLVAVRTWLGSKQRAAWQSWSTLAARHRQLASAAAGFCRPGMRHALLAWRETARQGCACDSAMHRACMGLRMLSVRRALTTWAAASAHGTERELMSRALGMLMNLKLARGWATWVCAARTEGEMQRRIRTAVSAWLGSRQREAWARWCEMADVWGALASSATVLRYPSLRAALMTWAEVTESALSSGALLGEALASLRSVGLRRAFSSWRAASERLLGLSCLGYSILARETRMGFATWQENAFEMQSRRGAMASAVSSLLHLRERRGFHSWSVAARGMKRAQQLICRAALRMANVGLGNGWQTWVQHAAHRKHALGVLRSSAGFFLGSCRARCFGLWRAASRAYSHASAQLAIGARFIAHLQHQHVSRGWSTWVSRHAEVTRLRRCLLVAVRTWLGSKQRAAWQSWSTLAARHRQLASAAAGFCRPGMRHALLAWRETARQGCACDSAMHRACMGLRMLSVRRALTTWAAASAHGTERELMSRALGMLMNLKLARGWATWVCAARTEGEMQRRIRTAVSAWLGSRQREAWARWCEMADVWGALASSATVLRYPSLRAALMTWAEVTESALSSGALLGEALASLRSVGLRRAFSSWRAASERLLGLSCLGYSILARETRMGFATWQENAFEMQSRRGAMASAVSSLLHLRERRGFHSWSVAARGMKRAQQLICRAALRMANVGLGNGWQTWVQHAAHRKHALGVLRSSAGFFLGSCRARCFGLWRAASRAYSHASAQLAIGARFIAHLQHQHVSRGWSTWVSRHAEVTRLRRCLLVAVRTWLGSKQRAAWQSWSTLAARHRQLASAAAGFCRPGMRHALLAWRETARQGCACDSAMHRACMGLRMLSVRRALTTWAAASAHGTERELMSRALGMLMNLKLARGWATWVCAARTEGEMQRRIRTAVSAWLGSRQREAWARWCEMADVWGALASSATVLRYPSLRAALMTWAEVTESALSSGALLGEALASLRSVGLRRAFSSWRAASERLLGLSCLGYSILARETRMGFATWQENAFEMQSRRGAMASAVSSLLHLRERRGFHSWSVAARGMKRAQQLICRAALRMANVGLGNGWQTWVQHAAHRKHALGVLRSSAGFFLGSCRARCFGLWRAASRAYSHASAQLAIGARFIAHLQHQHVSRGWSTWVSRHAEVTRLRRCLLVAVRTWLGSKQRAAWQSWSTLAARHRQLASAAAGFCRPGMRHALRRWVEATEDALFVDSLLGEALASLRFLGLCRSFRSWKAASELALGLWFFGYSLLARETRTGFATWQAKAAELATSRRRLAVAVAASRSPSMRYAFHTWALANAQSHVRQAVMLRACSGLNMLTSRRAWCSWRDFATSSRSCDCIVKRVLSSLFQRSSRRAFCAWWTSTRMLTISRSLLQRSVLLLSNVKLAAAWRSWMSYKADRLEAVRWLRSSARLFTSSSLAAGFDALLAASQRSVHLTSIMASFSTRNMAQRAFLTWLAFARQSTTNMQLVSRAVRSLLKLRERRAFSSWVAAAASLAASHSSLQHVLLQLRSSKLAVVWRTWQAHVTESLDAFRVLRSSARFFTSSSLAAGFNTWLAASLHSTRLDRFLTLMLATSTRRALGAWQSLAKILASNRLLASRAVRSLLKLRERRAFSSWVAAAASLAASSFALRRMLLQLRSSKLAVGWRTWRARMTDGRRATRLLRSSARFFTSSSLAAGFDTWLAASQESAVLCRFIASLHSTRTRRALTSWTLITRALSAQAQLLARAWCAMTRPEHAAFRTWLSTSSSLAAARSSVYHTVLRLKNAKLAAGWNSWRSFATQRSRAVSALSSSARFFTSSLARSRLRRMEVGQPASRNPAQSPGSMLVARGAQRS